MRNYGVTKKHWVRV